MILQQYELVSKDKGSELICWLPVDSRFKVGTRLTLKEIPDTIWTINKVYSQMMTHESLHFIRGWKVGGIE